MSNFYVISPNVQNDGKTDFWLNQMFNNHTSNIGWNPKTDDGGKLFDSMTIEDYVICAHGANKNKKCYFAGKVASPNYQKDINDTYSRKIDGFIDISKMNNLFTEGNAYGAAPRIPAIYQLHPETSPADKTLCEIIKKKVDAMIKQESKIKIKNILAQKKNIILQGAPGTGKTYNTAAIAISLIEENQDAKTDYSDHAAVMSKYKKYVDEEQIGFVTFHQSMDYEDFVEGLKPEITENGNINYKVENGIFKEMCLKARKEDRSTKPYILIIDEINRGNVSKILGELITLLEADKRSGGDHPLSVTLPYSKKSFEVPSNFYIVGTMNTTDRSVGNIDYAVRRRFAFVTLESSKDALDSYYAEENQELKDKAKRMFDSVHFFLGNAKSDMDIADLMVGHSYFMAKSEDDLKLKWEYEIYPLIQEYYKDGIITERPEKDIEKWKQIVL